MQASNIGNEFITNDTIKFFDQTAIIIPVISNHNSFRAPFDKPAPVIIYLIDILIFQRWMAISGNRHCADCIGELSFAVVLNTVNTKYCLLLQ